jgi:hypothetical protein
MDVTLWALGFPELALAADLVADCFDRGYKLPSSTNMVLWSSQSRREICAGSLRS